MAERIGRIVTNEQTGERAWWDGQSITPVQIDIDPKQPTAAQDIKTLAGPMRLPEMTPSAPVTHQPPRFPGVEQFIQQATGPALTAAAGFIPGSIPLQMGIGAGTEALSELASGQPMNLGKIGTAAATPAAARGVMGLLRGATRVIAKQGSRESVVEAGVGKAQQLLGVGGKATQKLETAKSITTPVTQFESTTKTIEDIVKTEKRIPGGSDEATKIAEGVLDKLTKPGQDFEYKELFESVKALRQQAHKAYKAEDHRLGTAINSIRSSLIDDMTKVDPTATEALKLYRRQESLEDVASVFRSSGRPLNKVKDLLAKDPLVAGAFNAAEKKTLEVIAKQIGPDGLAKIASAITALGMGGFAVGGTGGSAVATLAPVMLGALVTHPSGQIFARSLIGPSGKINQAAIPAFAQLLRGYWAETQGQ